MPGSTCPADKDRTPAGSSESSFASITSVPLATPTATGSPSRSITASPPSLDADITFSLAEPSFKTVTQSALATATPSGNAPESTNHIHSPVAAIVGAVLGTIIFCALLVSILLHLRKRRHTKIYKAPDYPSPLVGSDMTPQLTSKASSQFQQKIAALYRTESITEPDSPTQLDSREIGRDDPRRNGSVRHFAELPAEPLPWPGNSSHD
ncbi:hypothetical protein G6011_02100 [Alternaria panax]|uniref:Uncharacterized protein n=1 Tax=Alternaria panax TaxID=48097 RepID=A0AAD4FE55_9PLEO|nr:hypothetical protein G6011_02100 [Alternaria panax]